MEEGNKNKPLSADEIFDLIENKSNGKRNELNLDDFESDALEGFNSFSTFEKAKKMNAEIDLAISKKVSDNSRSAKNKIIWFAAAASIISMIFMSVFYFKNSKNNTELALAESQKKELTIEETIIPNKDLNVQQDVKILTGQEKSKLEEVQFPKKSKMFDSEIESNKEKIENLVLKDEITNTNVSKRSLTAKDSEAPVETQSIEMEADISITKNEKADKKNVSQNNGVDTYSKAIAKENVKPSDYKEEEFYNTHSKKKSESSAPSAKISQTTALKQDLDLEKNFYYVGGEIALKNDLILEMRNENPTFNLNGKYKFKIIINTNSAIEVVSISTLKNDCKECLQKIERALNALKKWIPEVKNGDFISSKKEFTLDF